MASIFRQRRDVSWVPCCKADLIEAGVSRQQPPAQCYNCTKPLPTAPQRCSRCQHAAYCDIRCQCKDLEMHKIYCSEGYFRIPGRVGPVIQPMPALPPPEDT
jgi:hypothetical protein